ncbi:cholinesterase, partial [Trichonephila inaurata madagascariensis]
MADLIFLLICHLKLTKDKFQFMLLQVLCESRFFAICVSNSTTSGVGDILPLSPLEAVLHRNIKDIPIVIGSAAQAVDFWPGPEDLPSWSWNQYRKYVTTSLDSFDPRISQLTMQLYNTSETNDEDPTPELLYTTMVTDIRQTCPVNDFTDMLSSVTNSPVFRYVITSRPSAP